MAGVRGEKSEGVSFKFHAFFPAKHRLRSPEPPSSDVVEIT
jgi:hypothetical protein